MIDFCSTTDAIENAPAPQRETPPPRFLSIPQSLTEAEVRTAIDLRDKLWTALKNASRPSASALARLRIVNLAIVKALVIQPGPFQPSFNQVEGMLCIVCEIFLERCKIEIAAENRSGRQGIDLRFLQNSFKLAAADEELEPPDL